MTENDVFERTKGAYLCLIHPVRCDDRYEPEIESVLALAPLVPDELVASLITGASWRERLLGLCMGMAKEPTNFIEPMLQSLRDPRGISIVPTCAVLAVLARRGVFAMTESFALAFDRRVFDGEIGWAIDKAMRFAGVGADDVAGTGPNFGQVFEDHAELYRWITG